MARRRQVKPRFWLFIMLTFLVVFTPLYIVLNVRSNQLAQSQLALAQTKAKLAQSISELQHQINYVNSDLGVEQLARESGMIMPGEVRYVPSR